MRHLAQTYFATQAFMVLNLDRFFVPILIILALSIGGMAFNYAVAP